MTLLASCSSTKFVGEGEYLLDKNIIVSDNRDYKPSDMKPYLRQQPNFKAFGLMKWQLYVYGWSGYDGSKWWNKQLRRIGEAPVILDTTQVELSVKELDRFLMNKGYVNAEVTASIDTSRTKKAIVTYEVESNDPYRIRDYSINLDDTTINRIAHQQAPRSARFSSPFRTATDDYSSLIREGALFDRDQLDRERQRVTSLLRRRGYYAFNRENLAYVADSTLNDHKVDLEMVLKPARQVLPDGTTIEQPHRQYYIKDITIMTDYDPLRLENVFTPTDTVMNRGIRIIYGESGKTLRSGMLRRNNFMRPGGLFNERALEQTYSSFASLAAIRNTNIRFEEVMENDTMKLNAVILASLAKVHGIGFDLEGTNSAGDFGFAASTNYTHRNLFKGSEVFTAKVRGAYESLSGGNKEIGFRSYWELGGETSLTIPRFVFPFLTENFRRRLRASTEFRLSYNRQTRPEYKRAIVSGGWNYIWQQRTNTLARHTFKLLDVDYLYLPHIEPSFRDSLPETTRLNNYSNVFIVGSGYSFSFNDFNPQNRQRNTRSFRASIDLAGNMLYGLSKLTNASKDENGQHKLFGINYSQFIKTDFDFSRGVVLDTRNKLAYHLGFGIVVPYGNANRVPFERRYFSGGANSVRGWSVRSLGPGSMAKDSTANFATQVGDIRFDANLEYRTKLFWKFEMAAYVDAGNVWTIRNYDDQKDGKFDFRKFYKEIAFSYGLGLRLDFDFFLVRLDTGFKAYDPQEKGSRKWAIINPRSFSDVFALHFAVGYPF